MDLDFLRRQVGEEAYKFACEQSRKFAVGTGSRLHLTDEESKAGNVPHELCYMIWDSQLQTIDKLRLTFQLYEEMPCYAVLMYISLEYGHFEYDCKTLVWDYYKLYLDGKDDVFA